MSKHSPLPWQLDPTGGMIQDADGNAVIDVDCNWQAESMSTANAELVILCVNLHAELVKLVFHLKHDAKYYHNAGQWIDEVLAKAKGNQ